MNGAISSTASGPVGADFKPLASSAPAAVFQSPPVPATVGASTDQPPNTSGVPSKPAMVVAPGATSRLVHPAEDISLEEKRATMAKYAPKTPSLPTPNMETSVSQPQVPAAVPNQVATVGVPPISRMPVSAPLHQQQPLMTATSAPSMLRPGLSTPNNGPPQHGLHNRMQGPPRGMPPGLLQPGIGSPMQRPPVLPQMGQFPGMPVPMRPGMLPFPGDRMPQRMPMNFQPRF